MKCGIMNSYFGAYKAMVWEILTDALGLVVWYMMCT